jgi:potassium efflux system protein
LYSASYCPHFLLTLWLVIVAIPLFATAVHAQEQVPLPESKPAAIGKLTPEMVEQRIKELDALTDLDEATRAELTAIYQEAGRLLTLAADYEKRASAFAEESRTAPDDLQRAQFQKSVLNTSVTIDVPPDATLGQLDEQLKVAQGELAEAKRLQQELKTESGRRPTRRSEISEKVKQLRETRPGLAAELAAKRGSTAPKDVAVVARLQAQLQALDAEFQLYEQELAAYAATVDLLPIQLELAERNVSLGEKRVELWNRQVEIARTAQVQMQERAAALKAERTTGALEPLAVRNQKLAAENRTLVADIQDVNADLKDSQELLDDVKQKFQVTQDKVDSVGLNFAIGLLLRKEDAALPNVSKYRRNSRQREETIRDVQLRIIDLAVDRSKLTDVDYVDEFIDSVEVPAEVSRDEFTTDVVSLVEQQLELLATLQKNANDYFERLVDLESTEQQLCEAVAQYETYIDERVLWIRSSEPLAWTDIKRSVASMQWFLAHEQWEKMIALALDALDQHWFLKLPVLLGWLVWLFFQRRLRTAISQLGERAASGSCRSYMPTALTLIWTLLITGLWPALMMIVVWSLQPGSAEDEFSRALAVGLTGAAVYYLALEFLRQVCRPNGLADAHFGWPSAGRSSLRRNLRWLMAVTVPLVFAAGTLYAHARSRSEETLALSEAQEATARLCTMLMIMAAAVFTYRVLHPQGALFRSLSEETPEPRLYRMRHVIYVLALAFLGFLLVLALIGFDFTVARLVRRFYESVLLLEILLVTTSLISRWLVVARRRLAIAHAQQRRAQTVAQSEESSGLAAQAIAESTPNLAVIGDQSRQLLESLIAITALGGFWLIWTDVIPALNFLEEFKLWTVTSGATEVKITANNVVLATVIVVATVLATKNIPGLLEIAVLSRLPLDAGNRYAIITIIRYVLTIVGIILAFSSIGILWSKYQWLVAAASVGLGFGLQEIFANFVSGLIVLFEQPIRVGDVVTIGNVTGVVSKIRMRATTVTNWDRQEFIVPNREFITGQLLNWTLSNTVNRVLITAGVAYGSDPDRVRQIMLDVANQHPTVLDDPAPNVTFEQFGDSTLNIVLRCYLPTMDERLATIHALNTAVHEKLNAAGIAFAFPTRELYFKNPLPPPPPPQSAGDASARAHEAAG